MYKFLIALLIAGIMFAGFQLAPSRRELAFMKMESASYSEALSYYLSLRSNGDTSLNTLVAIIRLYLLQGNVDKAIELLEVYVTDVPDSIPANQDLARLYKATQRYQLYCKQLEKLYQLSPSVTILHDLADTYNFLGQYTQEMTTLAKLVAHEDYRPREQDYMRLASYQRLSGKPNEAVTTAVYYVTSYPQKASVDIVYLASYLLLEHDRPDSAFEMADAYFKYNRNMEDVTQIAALFRGMNQLDASYALLHPYLHDDSLPSEVLEQIVATQLQQGKRKEIYELLSDKFYHVGLSKGLTITLMDLAIYYQNYELAQKALYNTLVEEMPPEEVLRYAFISLDANKPEIASYIQSRLDESYLEKQPLLSAVLTLAVNDTQETLTELAPVFAEYCTLPEQRLRMANFYLSHHQAEAAYTLVHSLPVSDILSYLDISQFAHLYLSTGHVPDGVERLVEARNQIHSIPPEQIDLGLLLMAAGSGDRKIVESWIEKTSDTSKLKSAYEIAAYYKQFSNASALLEHIYTQEPTDENRLELANILLMNRQFSKALKHLETLADKNQALRPNYLYALSQWIMNPASQTENNSMLVSHYLARIIKWPIAEKEKHMLAYALAEAGFQEQSETLLVELSGGKEYMHPYVQDLLALWGEDPSPNATSWIAARAYAAEDSEKALWLNHLNSIKRSDIVLSILENSETFSVELTDIYINALLVAKKRDKLRSILASEIRQEKDISRLKKLMLVAKQEDLQDISEKGWKRLYASNPNDQDALRELGLLAFAAHRYSEAEKFLAQYIQHDSDNYTVNFTYGDILYRKGKKGEASTYFQRAEQALTSQSDNSLHMRLIKAYLLYRNDKVAESIALYRNLLDQYPSNKTVRADFAEVLIATKRFDEASTILQP